MGKWLVKLMTSLLLNVSAQAIAATDVDMIWTDRQGFKSGASCKIEEAKAIGFRVARGPKYLILQSTDKTAGNDDLSEYVIQIMGKSPVSRINSKVKAVRSFWQVAMKGNLYLTAKCGSKNYVLFDVYVREGQKPVARIGVDPRERKIFRSILIHTPEEAEVKIEEETPEAKAETTTNVNQGSNQTSSTGSSSSSSSSSSSPSSTATSSSSENSSSAVNGTTPESTTQTPNTSTTQTPAEASEQTSTSNQTSEIPVVQGSLEHLICLKDGDLQVRKDNLNDVAFKARKLETVKPMQTFGGEKKTLTINGQKYVFIKVQFPDRAANQNVGWVAESYVKLKGDCPHAQNPQPTPRPQPGPISGLNDPDCCVFPTLKRATTSYSEGMRRFRAGRSGGRRLHAACDIYRLKGDEAVAVAPGTVLRGHYYFYQGTYAIEVMHAGGFVVRYGEVTGKAAPGVKVNAKVAAGQTLGYIGKVNSNCCEPMLHFELYSGKLKGASLSGGGQFQRRSDLMDPTTYLRTWEKKKFGVSY